MTGQTHSSLPTRYIRIKAAIARVDDEHLEALQKAKADVEREIEEDIKAIRRQFWTKVAAKMEEDVGKKYDVSDTFYTILLISTDPPTAINS